MAGKKTIKSTGKNNKMILPGPAGPKRNHYCAQHDEKATPVRIFGSRALQFECKAGCRLTRKETVLK